MTSSMSFKLTKREKTYMFFHRPFGFFQKYAIKFLTQWHTQSWSVVHTWSSPQVRTVKETTNAFSNTPDYTVAFTQTCFRCHSHRYGDARLELNTADDKADINLTMWSLNNIKHPTNYQQSACHSRYVARFAPQIHNEILEDQRKKQRLYKQYVKQQKKMNYQIIHQLRDLPRPHSLNKLRRDLAIYRLYRYCDEPPLLIAAKMELAEQTIKQTIGSTFKLLCLTDNQCIFKPFFLQHSTVKR